jgi:GH24 family phage-related lysozyme (muramidase)
MANHCTFGVGTLVHHGPCTDEELHRPVTAAQVDAQLARRVHSAEAAVRLAVSHAALSQAQFDSLVSFVYNVGARGAATALAAADRGAPSEAATHITANVYVHPRDAQGLRLAPVLVPGLVNRRQGEAAPFVNACATR